MWINLPRELCDRLAALDAAFKVELDRHDHIDKEDVGDLKTPLIERARELYEADSNDDIEVDDEAAFSPGDGGCWVQAWLWVRWAEVTEEEFNCSMCGEEIKGEGDQTLCADCTARNTKPT